MKLRSRGRGTGYSPLRGVVESVLTLLYTGGWPARLWGLVPGATSVREIHHSITLPDGGGPICRLALLSDIHVGPTTPDALLQRVLAVLDHANPDVLLLGGDYVYLEAHPRVLERLTDFVASVQTPTKLAVMGNHDLWTHDQMIAAALEKAGATVLVNETCTLPPPWDDVVVVGLDEPWTGNCNAGQAYARLDGQPFRIVLCHSPDGLSQLSEHDFDIYLSGHTHGGHLATPWGPLILPNGRLCREYPSGFRRFRARPVFVSRGIGGVELPMRTFAPPEVLLLDLVRPNDQPS